MVLDIEGTTTSISFVADVLFPYVRREVASFLSRTYDSPETQSDIDALRQLSQQDVNAGKENVTVIPAVGATKEDILESTLKNVITQMDSDRKSTALKQLQGHIWKHGFESGELLGDIYEDALEAFKKWHPSTPIFIYSSGSIAAQKLLFGYNKHGNLLNYIVDHFDTTIGSKVEEDSYVKIFDFIASKYQISLPTLSRDQVLFGTDNINEAIAAEKAGLSTFLSIRADTPPLPSDHHFHAVYSFSDVWNFYSFL